MPKSNGLKVNVMQIGSGTSKHWQLSHNGDAGGPGHYPQVDVPAKAAADITFQIVNANGVTFSQDPISVNDEPSKPSGKGLGQYITVTSGPGTTQLVIHDSNINPATLNYVLNFTGAPSLDPIIQNGGGGPPTKNYEYLIAGAIVLALLAAFLVRKMFVAKPGGRDSNAPL